jgi:hypothetical protein
MNDVKFSADKITDQKRYVRGEHLLLARSRLRARDGVHHKPWRVLMLAGGNPAEEINAIRSLMPKSHITAVDVDARLVSLAKDCGADDAIVCDLSKIRRDKNRMFVAKEIDGKDKFDLIDLDFCGNPTEEMSEMAIAYSSKLTTAGILMVTFSYGRDVVEVLDEMAWSYHDEAFDSLISQGCPRLLVSRIRLVLRRQNLWEGLRSVMVYKGASMPMCAVLCQRERNHRGISFVKVEECDFEFAVLDYDPCDMYACPKERSEAIRRKFAAIKAHITRSKPKHQDGVSDCDLLAFSAD